MQTSTMKTRWKDLAGHAKRHWGKLTDDDLMTLEGDRDRLISKIEERYELTKQDAEQQVDEWIARL